MNDCCFLTYIHTNTHTHARAPNTRTPSTFTRALKWWLFKHRLGAIHDSGSVSYFSFSHCVLNTTQNINTSKRGSCQAHRTTDTTTCMHKMVIASEPTTLQCMYWMFNVSRSLARSFFLALPHDSHSQYTLSVFVHLFCFFLFIAVSRFSHTTLYKTIDKRRQRRHRQQQQNTEHKNIVSCCWVWGEC